jgi:beta-lactamase regulating signal transducer with metallopeptidase domain
MQSALTYALLHSLWQSALVGAVLWIALLLTRSATIRYAMSCVALAVCIAALMATFVIHLDEAASPIVAAQAVVPVNDVAVDGPMLGPVAFPLPVDASIAPASTSVPAPVNLAFLVPAVWLAGVMFFLLRLIVAWLRLRALYRSSTPLADAQWIDRLDRLKRSMRVRRAVELRRSDRIDSPAVMGLIRPVLLWPVSSMSGLTGPQIDALLAHELAHIRRHDYLVNLLQCLCEILMFYHPVVWLISRQIRIEREHCCDDLAASVVGDRIVYAEALSEMESIRFTLSMNASGGSLVHRMKRLLAPPPAPRRGTRSVLILVALCCTAIVASHFVGPDPVSASEPTSQPTTVEAMADDNPSASSVAELLEENQRLREEILRLKGALLTDIRGDPFLDQLREQERLLTAQADSLRARLGPRHPLVINIDREIENLRAKTKDYEEQLERNRAQALQAMPSTRQAAPRFRFPARAGMSEADLVTMRDSARRMAESYRAQHGPDHPVVADLKLQATQIQRWLDVVRRNERITRLQEERRAMLELPNGLNTDEAKARIAAELKNVDIELSLLDQTVDTFVLSGNVQKPGSYELYRGRPTSLMQALIIGGVMQGKQVALSRRMQQLPIDWQTKVTVIRKLKLDAKTVEQQYTFTLAELLQPIPADADITSPLQAILPDDRIEVE